MTLLRKCSISGRRAQRHYAGHSVDAYGRYSGAGSRSEFDPLRYITVGPVTARHGLTDPTCYADNAQPIIWNADAGEHPGWDVPAVKEICTEARRLC